MVSKVAFPVDIDIRKYKIAMKIYRKDALPKAVAETLNRTADAVTKQQIKNVRKDMIIRSKFTLRSMESKRARPWKALNKAMGKNIDRMFSRAGTFSNYLWKQEETDTYKGMMGGPIPIPTRSARVSSNLKKPVSGRFRLSPGQNLSKEGSIASNMFIGRPQGRKLGVYTRKFTGVEMVRNLESKQITIPGTGFHSKAVKKFGTQQFIKAQFIKVSKRILKRKGIA